MVAWTELIAFTLAQLPPRTTDAKSMFSPISIA
jgi:hypothetical protein